VAERTDLALILFGVATWGFKPLHPAGFPLDALEEISRLETAAALKYEAAERRSSPPSTRSSTAARST
jgi:4-hydroxy-tetrahydrodipicolinate synthase